MNPNKVKKSQGNDSHWETPKAILKKEIGERLREIRKSLKFTQDQMVKYFNCGRANYSRIEKGEVFPNPSMLEMLYKRFDVSLHWLICGDGEMKKGQAEAALQEAGYPGIGANTGEIKELLFYLERIPMIKHAVLGFFLEYMEENKRLIAPLLKRTRPSPSKM